MKNFRETAPSSIDGNFIDRIGRQWMLVTAGDGEKCNTMTASWGAAGVIWNRPAAFVFIRPQRYTKEFVDANRTLTLSFLPEEYRSALTYCGSHSGRDGDKITDAGLSVCTTPAGTAAIVEAELILECRRMYAAPMGPDAFTEASMADQWYPEKDFHHMYICEIEKAYVKKEEI